jgi:flagellar biosynthesis protein FlhB
VQRPIRNTIYGLAAKIGANMTRLDLTRLFVRIFGLMILLNVVLGLQLSIYIFSFNQASWDAAGAIYTLRSVVFNAVSSIGALVPYAIVGLGFLWFGGRIVDGVRLAPKEGEAVESADLRNMEISLIVMLGLYILADGFAELCRCFSQGVSHAVRGEPRSVIWNAEVGFVVQGIVKLTLGALFVLRREGAVAVLHRIYAWVRKWRAWPD